MKKFHLGIIALLLIVLFIIPIGSASSDLNNTVESNFEDTISDESEIEASQDGDVQDVSYYSENNENIVGPDLSTDFTDFKVKLTEKNTFYVNSSYTGKEETGTINTPFKTLKSALAELPLNRYVTTISIADGVYSISNPTSLSKSLNIIGQNPSNTIIDGRGSQLFFMKPNNIVLNIFNLTITGGYSYYGGAIYNNQSTLNVVNAIFKDNVAEGMNVLQENYSAAGGAIYNEAGICRIYNSTFINNKAISSLNSFGGAIYTELGSLNIFNSKFYNNSIYNASYGVGGAIYNYNGYLTISNSTLSGNLIDSNYSVGGVIYNYASRNTYILNSNLTDNVLKGDYTFASAIFNKGVLLEVVNSTISDNIADGIGVENSTVYNINGYYNLINSTMSNNTIRDSKKNILMCLEDQLVISQAFDDTEELLKNLPKRYDLRDEGLVTSVKNQGSSGACWSFTVNAALESFLLKYENKTYDFSENNMKNVMGSDGLNGTDWDEGGNYLMAIAYLLSWQGPINESDDPFSAYSIIPNYDVNTTKHVQGTMFLPLRLGYLDVNQIKCAIMKYGALYTSIYGTNLGKTSYNSIAQIPNHAVAIVGWDDNYSASRFSGTKPAGNGAFIYKNSWGTSFGERGYGYISYYDMIFAGFTLDSVSAMAITDVEDVDNYKGIYQYDILGNTFESLGFNSNTAWLANQFTASSDNPLSAFGLYTFGKSDYLVDIFVNGELKYTQEGKIAYAGYHTIKLNQFVDLNKGDIFRINVKLTTLDSLLPIAIESQREGYSSKATADVNQSFVSPDGIDWYDISNNLTLVKFSGCTYDHVLTSANVCLKAYTVFMGNLVLDVSGNASLYVKNDILAVTLNLTNYGDDVKGINISLGLDEICEISSYNLTIGSINNNLWLIDKLNNGQSAILNLTLKMTGTKDVVENLFTVNCSDFSKGNNSTVPFMANYSNLTKFVVNDVDTLSRSGDRTTITLLDALNRPLINEKIILNGNTTLITDMNGSVEVIFNLTKGNYIYNISFNGNDIYESGNASFRVNVAKRLSTLVFNGTDESYYPASFIIYLFDGNSNPLANKSVNFVANNVNLTLVSDANGTLNLSSLKAGNYKISASFDNDELYEDSILDFNVSVIKKDVSVISKNMATTTVVVKVNGYTGKYFKVTLKDSDGKLLAKKKIKFTISGKTYYRTTNSKGVASLQVNLAKSGKYAVAVKFLGDDFYKAKSKSFKITVNKKKMSLKVPKKTFKSSAKVKKLTATLKDNKGKLISGKKIVFKVNGKKYVAKTNKKGIATVKVKLSKKKVYSFTAKFAGDKSYNKITTKSKVKIR